MSLQSDFELCLEYAEELEDQQSQRVQAQNNIIFMQNESERIKNKVKICTTLAILSMIGIVILALIVFVVRYPMEYIPFLGIFVVLFIITLTIGIKTKKESNDFESRKPLLIQRYTADAEACERRMAALVKEIYQEDLFDIVPKDYFSVVAIEFCLNQVRKKLANTASEAFRQLDAEIKRLEHMEYLEQMNNEQMDRLDDIKRAIEINTMITLAEQEKRNS